MLLHMSVGDRHKVKEGRRIDQYAVLFRIGQSRISLTFPVYRIVKKYQRLLS